jgi:hypothetical protein
MGTKVSSVLKHKGHDVVSVAVAPQNLVRTNGASKGGPDSSCRTYEADHIQTNIISRRTRRGQEGSPADEVLRSHRTILLLGELGPEEEPPREPECLLDFSTIEISPSVVYRFET